LITLANYVFGLGMSRKLRTAIAIVVPVVVAGILLVGLCLYFERRKPRPEYTPEFEGKST